MKTVLVTGCSTGIGRACAMDLAQKGFTVFAGVRKESDGLSLKKELGGPIIPVILDVTNAGHIDRVAETIARHTEGKGLDGLVNNAGIVVPGPLEFVSLDDLRKQFEVNVIGQIALTQKLLPQIRQAKGRILNMGSVSGYMPAPFMGPYCASKFALRALNEALRLELRPWGIRVCLIEPGPIATPIWEKGRSEAKERQKTLPADVDKLYGAALNSFERAVGQAERSAIPVSQVSRAVVHALTSSRPRTHYLIGANAKMQALVARFFPVRLRDTAIAKAMHLP